MYVASASASNSSAVAAASAASESSAKDKRLQEACQEFEAVFLSLIWKEMSKSAGVDLGGWEAITDQAFGQSMAKSGGIGLAKVIYSQMEKHP